MKGASTSAAIAALNYAPLERGRRRVEIIRRLAAVEASVEAPYDARLRPRQIRQISTPSGCGAIAPLNSLPRLLSGLALRSFQWSRVSFAASAGRSRGGRRADLAPLKARFEARCL